jgi:hypothetical protein
MIRSNRNFAIRLTLALSLLAAANAASAAASMQWWGDGAIVAEGRFERSLNVSGAVDLEVKTNWGSIAVRTGDSSKVQVVGLIKVRRFSTSEAQSLVKQIEANPPIRQTGSTIVIGFDQSWEDQETRNRVGISYELVVPASTRVRAGTGSGSVTVDGVAGGLDSSTGSGSITLANIGGEARAHTGSGGISINGVKGQLRASTGSGSIRGTGVAGGITASTGSGEIELQQVSAGNVEVSTGSGSIELEGIRGAIRARTGSGSIRAQGEPTGTWSLRSSSGGITVRLPANAAFELDASTSSGSITTDHPITVVGTVGRRELRGKVRGGGPLLDLNTSSGSIRVE